MLVQSSLQKDLRLEYFFFCCRNVCRTFICMSMMALPELLAEHVDNDKRKTNLNTTVTRFSGVVGSVVSVAETTICIFTIHGLV